MPRLQRRLGQVIELHRRLATGPGEQREALAPGDRRQPPAEALRVAHRVQTLQRPQPRVLDRVGNVGFLQAKRPDDRTNKALVAGHQLLPGTALTVMRGADEQRDRRGQAADRDRRAGHGDSNEGEAGPS